MDRQIASAAQGRNMLYLAIGLGLISVVSCFSMAAAQMSAEQPIAAHSLKETAGTAAVRP